MNPLTTAQAAEHLATTYTSLISLIRYRRIAAPAKNGSGDYVWSAENLRAAASALKKRDQLARTLKEKKRHLIETGALR